MSFRVYEFENERSQQLGGMYRDTWVEMFIFYKMGLNKIVYINVFNSCVCISSFSQKIKEYLTFCGLSPVVSKLVGSEIFPL